MPDVVEVMAALRMLLLALLVMRSIGVLVAWARRAAGTVRSYDPLVF